MPDKEPDKYLEDLRAEAYEFYQSRPDNDVWDDMVQFARQCVERATAQIKHCERCGGSYYDDALVNLECPCVIVERAVAEERKEIAARLRDILIKADDYKLAYSPILNLITELETPEPAAGD